jgi:hypothetical protein
MSSNGKRNRGRVPYRNGKATPSQPGDEQEGGFSRAQLLRMDARFVERVQRAFANGSEHRQSAAMSGANASRLR